MDTGSIARNQAFGPDSAATRQRFAAWHLVHANRCQFDADRCSPELQSALTQLAQLEKQLAALQNSASWRFTAPLRAALARFRALAAGAKARPLDTEPPPQAPLAYRDWIGRVEPHHLAALSAPLRGIQAVWSPRLGIAQLPGALLSVPPPPLPSACQVLTLTEATPSGAIAQALSSLDSDFICFHDANDRVAPHALTLVAELLSRYPDTDVIFADEDMLDEHGGRTAPFFKPGWDAELQRGQDLLGPFTFLRATLIRQAEPPTGTAWRYDLATQIAARAGAPRILHIPAILCHRAPAALPPDDALRLAATAQLARDGITAHVKPAGPGQHRILYELPPVEPLVSIVICTKDQAGFLRACTDGILHATDYARFEILIVDNGSQTADAQALLSALSADPRIRILRAPGPFNWSALNNAAAAQADGDILVLLNNDIAVVRPDWLRVLVSHAIQPGIGAVGAKLLYPDGRIQHAGLSTDDSGIPAHVHRFAPGDTGGGLAIAREVWALTGACLAIPRQVFTELGGLNEALAIACNDVDFCLRLRAHGYRLIWTPDAVLQHHEQATRPSDQLDGNRERARAELDRLHRDWGSLALHDPYLNPNIQLFREQPVLRDIPMALVRT